MAFRGELYIGANSPNALCSSGVHDATSVSSPSLLMYTSRALFDHIEIIASVTLLNVLPQRTLVPEKSRTTASQLTAVKM